MYKTQCKICVTPSHTYLVCAKKIYEVVNHHAVIASEYRYHTALDPIVDVTLQVRTYNWSSLQGIHECKVHVSYRKGHSQATYHSTICRLISKEEFVAAVL